MRAKATRIQAADSDQWAMWQVFTRVLPTGLDGLTDAQQTLHMLVDPHVVKDIPVPRGATKNFDFVNRLPGMPFDAFRTYWRDVHGPIGSRIETILRYEQNHSRFEAQTTTELLDTGLMYLSDELPKLYRFSRDQPVSGQLSSVCRALQVGTKCKSRPACRAARVGSSWGSHFCVVANLQ